MLGKMKTEDVLTEAKKWLISKGAPSHGKKDVIVNLVARAIEAKALGIKEVILEDHEINALANPPF